VSQAEIQEARDSAFNLDAEVADLTPAVQHKAARKSAESTSQSRKPSRASQSQPTASTSKGQSDKPVKCYESSGYGHFARDCANRRQRQLATRNRTLNRGLARERLMNHVIGRIKYMDFALRSKL